VFHSFRNAHRICSIFLAHKGIDLNNRPQTGRKYWKAKVESIHRQSEDKSLLIVAWFYSPSDVHKELVPKNHINDE
jgi:hypothetical protein